MISLVVIYSLYYVRGKAANKKIAEYWVQENKEIFEHNFSHIGVGSQPGGALLEQESKYE